MKVQIIAAVADNNAIGSNGELAWNLPADQAFFYRQIEDAFLITGRKSFESIQGAEIFYNRPFVVITGNKDYTVEKGWVANTIPEAMTIASREANGRRICILGGAGIYHQMMDHADELIITEVHTVLEKGDAFFPIISSTKWQETRREDYEADAQNPYSYSFVFYSRIH
ncbi:MAG: dihydrofolate reductase [Chitinophagales bacterium]|nr:dihydrofolate reductase [Chitinophagales bacterium]